VAEIKTSLKTLTLEKFVGLSGQGFDFQPASRLCVNNNSGKVCFDFHFHFGSSSAIKTTTTFEEESECNKVCFWSCQEFVLILNREIRDQNSEFRIQNNNKILSLEKSSDFCEFVMIWSCQEFCLALTFSESSLHGSKQQQQQQRVVLTSCFELDFDFRSLSHESKQ
jgi:hypothetical protein